MKTKKLFFSGIIALFAFTTLQAQVELKINPIGLIFGSPDIGVEYGISKSIGLEGTFIWNFNNFTFNDVGYRNRGIGVRASARYYFAPNYGFDNWYSGLYTKYRTGTAVPVDETILNEINSNRFALGVLFGHKWATKHNVVFDVNLGVGRALIASFESTDGTTVDLADIPLVNFDLVATFAVGYRFGSTK